MSWRAPDDEEEEEDFMLKAVRDALILLVDCSAGMFKRQENGEVPFEIAVKGCVELLQTRMIANDNDLVGVCFYGTDKAKGIGDSEATDHVYVVEEIGPPEPSCIKQLERMLDGGYNFGHCPVDAIEFDSVLYLVNEMVRESALKCETARIFLFTDNDRPNCSGQIHQRVEDMLDCNIEIHPFFLKKDFDPTLFYSDILMIGDDADATQPFLTYDSLEDQISELKKRNFKKRSAGTVTWSLGNGVEIGTQLYNIIMEAKKPTPMWLDGEKNRPVRAQTTYVNSSGDKMLTSQIGFSQQFGDKTVVFDKEEKEKLKHFGDPGITLLGFKPLDSVNWKHNTRHSSFLFPDEDSLNGSDVAFAALHQKMLEMKKVAIVKIIPRRNANPRMAALIPQKETSDENGQLDPPGFNVIYLPFAEDIRPLKIPEDIGDVELSNEEKTAASELVQTLKAKKFEPDSFQNPQLQKYFATMAAVALDRDDVEDIPDQTMYDEEYYERHKDKIDQFKDILIPEDYDHEEFLTKSGRKRKEPDGESSKAPAKKAKVAVDVGDEDWSALVASGQHKKKSVAVLKAFLTSKGKKGLSKLKKGDLVQMVEDCV